MTLEIVGPSNYCSRCSNRTQVRGDVHDDRTAPPRYARAAGPDPATRIVARPAVGVRPAADPARALPRLRGRVRAVRAVAGADPARPALRGERRRLDRRPRQARPG